MKIKFWICGLLFAVVFLFGILEFFPRPGWVDPSIYSGYVVVNDLYKHYPLTDNSYQGSRLGYVFPLKFFSYYFGDVNGKFLYVLTLYFFYVFSVFILLKNWVKKDFEKFLLGVFFIFNPLIFSSISYGGADGPAAMQLMFATALFVCGEKYINPVGKFFLNFFAGVFLSLSISAHIFSIVPAIFIGFFLCTLYGKNVKFASLIVGGVVTIFLLTIVGFKFGLDRFYFLYSFPWARNSLNGSGTGFVQPLNSWWKNSIFWMPIFCAFLYYLFNLKKFKSYFKNKPFVFFACVVNLIGPLVLLSFYDLYIGGSLISTLGYFNIVFPSFLVGMVFLTSLYTNDSTPKAEISLFKAYGVRIFLSGLIFLNLLINFSSEHLKSIFSFNSINSRDLYVSQISFKDRVVSSDVEVGALRFVYKSIEPTNGSDPRIYKDFFLGAPRYFDYLDSLTALFLWDRSTALRMEPGTNVSLVNLNKNDGASVVFLGRNRSEIEQLADLFPYSLFGYTAEEYQCFEENDYPWCFVIFKIHNE